MGELLLCHETIAALPYYIEETGINIYSMEELSYYISGNVYLLDHSFMCESLCTWVEKQMHRVELAQKLRENIRTEGKMSDFVFAILQDTAYCTMKEMQEIVFAVRQMEQKSDFERDKIRADQLMEKEKYLAAIYRYKHLLDEADTKETSEVLRGNIWHNLGTAYARLFLFEEAGRCFEKAYAFNKQKESLRECLMCCRCEQRCPVGIELNTLRLNSRDTMRNTPDEKRYEYFQGVDRSAGEGRVGYFAGCMTLLTPRILLAMERIFKASGEEVWWADKEGGVCCGRPLKLSGETDSARKMMDYNIALFRKHRITTLVTSCPICLKVFREEYHLEGIEVLHHSEYMLRLIRDGRLQLRRGAQTFTYHDPCELGRGSRIYDQPREVIEAVGVLLEPAQTREHALCCGSSVANTAISDAQQLRLARSVAKELSATGAGTIVTACPLCKKAIARGADGREVLDLAEVVAAALVSKTVAAVPDKGV